MKKQTKFEFVDPENNSFTSSLGIEVTSDHAYEMYEISVNAYNEGVLKGEKNPEAYAYSRLFDHPRTQEIFQGFETANSYVCFGFVLSFIKDYLLDSPKSARGEA